MSEIKFKTEWLTQIALLANCGTPDDVADLCCAIQRASQGLPVNEMSPLTETLFTPIAESIEADRRLSKTRSEARTKNNKTATKTDKTSTKIDKEERETEKEKNQKKEITEKEEYITDASVDNTKVLSPSLSCSEPEKSASEPAEPPIISFLLNTGDEFPITREIFDNLAEAYPAVDTMQELRKIKNWCFSNPKNRKTKGGALRFVNSWFSKEQDRGPKPSARSGTAQRRLTASEIAALPMIDPFAEIRGT